MPYGKFPAKLTVAPASDIRQKTTVTVKNWDEVKNIQKNRYEIISWD